MLHLVRGKPGSGKTTLVLQVCRDLADKGIRTAGFVTEEIRRGGKRWGFLVRDLRGGSAVMARRGMRSPVRVGSYGVDLEAFEEIALRSICPEQEPDLFVVDEIGKMELSSPSFVSALEKVISGRIPLLATVPAYGLPFVDLLLSREDARVYEISPSNREAMKEVVLEAVLFDLRRSDEALGP
ncbi:MAG: NTPase [Candidatus Geothermincolales bacterium]